MSRRHANCDVFSAIADPTRRDILHLLGQGELPVSALAETFPTSLSAVSQHMRVLREAGLVSVRKEGRERYYRVNPEPLKTVAEWVKFYEPFWSNKLEALAAYLEQEAVGDLQSRPLSGGSHTAHTEQMAPLEQKEQKKVGEAEEEK